jgi:hypothetical protein
MTYVILRSGCHECHEPVDLVGAFSELEEATAAAAERMRDGERWANVALEVWRVTPGSVEHVLDVDYAWGEDGARTIVTREPTGGVEDEDDCDDEESE